jgi:murein DD-endopeptidase MepM/ murein hydrolase activator NlpD
MIQLDSEVFQELMLPLDRVLQFIIEREENFLNLPLGWPVTQGSITSDFGDRVSPFGFTTDFHSGTDFANVVGTPIFATASGEVTYAGNSNTGYGYYVKILHNHGFLTLYAHASKILVQEKQQVKRGEMIALMGRSGSVTGPHVHYEIRQFSLDEAGYPFELFLNPLPFVKEKW